MAQLPFNMRGYLFRKGLSDIRRAYDETILALESNRVKLENDLSNFERALSAGETGAWEYDEDGELLYSRERMHELLIEDALSTIAVAREAYVAILHHYWEKCCNEWMQVKRYQFDKAYKHLQAHGLAVDLSNLETLRTTCNTIKHGNQRSNLDADHIDRMFEAVKKSGIQTDWSEDDADLPQSNL